MTRIKDEYISRIDLFDSEIDKLKRRSGMLVIGKIIFFIAFIYSIYNAYPSFSQIGISLIVLPLLLYILVYWFDMSCVSKIEKLQRKVKVCQHELDYLDGDFSSFYDGSDYIDIYHEFSYDLDIFGKDSLYNRLNRTVTKRGRKMLASKFTKLADNQEEIDKSSEAVLELMQLVDWRIDFLSQPYIEDNLKELSSSIKVSKGVGLLINPFFSYIFSSLTITSLILGVMGVVSMTLFGLLFLVQLLLAIMLSRKTSHTNLNAEKLRREFKGYHYILHLIHTHNFNSTLLVTLHDNLFNSHNSSSKAFKELSKILNMFDQRNNEFTYIILNGLFLYDIYLIRKFDGWKRRYHTYVDQWIDSIAQLDALVSLATYAYNNPDNVPARVIDDNDNILECRGVYHPFLWRKRPVDNDFVIKRDNIAIITGANMAGKSTFLRTIGVNYILATCGAPVAAKFFRFSIISLFSSMRTTDNLSKDISYFNAELLRLQQLIEFVKSHDYALIILDEILKGTNSKDKLEGSIMFLKEISRYNVSGIIATHDLELSKLEDNDGDLFVNYCFEIELANNITYSYKISRGVSRNMNATFLLRNIIKQLN